MTAPHAKLIDISQTLSHARHTPSRAHVRAVPSPVDLRRRSEAHIKSELLQKTAEEGDYPSLIKWMNGYTDELLQALHDINPSLAHGCADFLSTCNEKTRLQWTTWLSPTLKRLLQSLE